LYEKRGLYFVFVYDTDEASVFLNLLSLLGI